MDQDLAKTAIQLIQSTLPIQSEFDESDDFGFDRLQEWLTSQVAYLIDHDFGKLLEALYRIDIPEKTFKEILKNKSGSVASQLASAILARQLKKAETRIKYEGW